MINKLPDKWCVKATKENESVLRDWRGGNHRGWKDDLFMLSDKFWGDTEDCKGYTEITFEQFKKWVLKEPEPVDSWCVQVNDSNRKIVKEYFTDWKGNSFCNGAIYGINKSNKQNYLQKSQSKHYNKYFDKLLTTEEFYEKIGHAPEMKFETGKWYKFKDYYPRKGLFCKFKELSDNNIFFYFSEFIADKEHKYYNGNWKTEDCIELLTDLSEIQPFLPEGHPDKKSIEKWSVGTYVVFLVDYGGHLKGSVTTIREDTNLCVKVNLLFKEEKSYCNLIKNAECKWFPTLQEAEEFSKSLQQSITPVDEIPEYVEWEPQVGDWCYTDEFGIKLFKVLKVEGRKIYNINAGWVDKYYPSFRKATPEEIASVQKPGINPQLISVEVDKSQGIKPIIAMSKEELLEEAKKRFPVGTKFKDLVHNEIFTVSKNKFDFFGKEEYVYVLVEKNSRNNRTARIYKDGVWAETFTKYPLIPEECYDGNKVNTYVQDESGQWNFKVAKETEKAWNDAMYTLTINEIASPHHSINTHRLTNKGKKFSPIKAELINVKKLKIN